MARDTLTLQLTGDVSLDVFAQVVSNFYSLVKQLSEEVVGANLVTWEIAKLESGSTTTTIRGQHPTMEEVEKVVRAYSIVGQSLETNQAIPYSTDVIENAISLTSVLNGNVTAINFITDFATATLVEAVFEESRVGTDYSFGVIKGVVGAIWIRPLKLAVYDAIFNRVVYCYLEQEDTDTARDVWGKGVEVHGLIRRDSETGRPIDVRNVSRVQLVERSDPKSYHLAKGIIPWKVGTEAAEVIISRLRNG